MPWATEPNVGSIHSREAPARSNTWMVGSPNSSHIVLGTKSGESNGQEMELQIKLAVYCRELGVLSETSATQMVRPSYSLGDKQVLDARVITCSKSTGHS